MNYLLGIVSIVCCLILVSFDTFTGSVLSNVAWWGVGISVLYMILSAVEVKESTTS